MDGVGEYHAKRNKVIPKNQRLNVLSDMWMLTYNEDGEERIEVYWIRQNGMKGRRMEIGKTVE